MKHDRSRRAKTARQPATIPEVDFDIASLTTPLRITELTEVAGNSGRIRIAIAGVEAGSLTVDYVVDHRLQHDTEVTRDAAVDILNAIRRTRVLDKALDLLAVRARSSRDLRIRLRRANAADDDITWAIDRLQSQGYVDDPGYARQLARSKALSGGVSRRHVVSTLRRKGITAEVAEHALDEVLADVDLDERGAALAAAQRRLRALGSLDAATRKQRLYAYLARRGYETGIIRSVLKDVLDASAPG